MECNLYAVRVFIEHWDESVEFYENVLELECVFKDKDMGLGIGQGVGFGFGLRLG